MRKILSYLKTHIKSIPHPAFWAGFLVFLAFSIWARYFLKVDTFFHRQDWKILKGIALYMLPYFFAIGWYSLFKKNWGFLKEKGFWILSTAILFVLVGNQFLLFYKPFIRNNMQTYPFFRLFYFNLHTAFLYALIPILFLKLSSDRANSQNFGLTLNKFDAKPYAVMLAIMLPLLIWASFQPDFLKAYPRYKPGATEAYWQITPWLTVSLFELSYIIQFVFLEWFFRGFMIMKLEKYLGKGAVFPMVAVYCFIHFGKPMAETAGSIFGGYILGVIALSSRTVFGGILIHVGIALLMELLAFLQRTGV